MEVGGHGAPGAVAQRAISRSAIVDMAAAVVGEGGRVIVLPAEWTFSVVTPLAGGVTRAGEAPRAEHQRRRVAGPGRFKVAVSLPRLPTHDRLSLRHVGGLAVPLSVMLSCTGPGVRRKCRSGRARDGQGLAGQGEVGSGVTVIV